MPAPASWVLNEEASYLNDANVFLPPGKNEKNSDRQMLIRAHPKSDPDVGPTLADSIKKGIRYYQSLYVGGTYSDSTSIPSGSGGSVRIYDFKPGKRTDVGLSYESWVFLEEPQCFVDIILGAPSQEIHDASLPAFKWLVSNFRKK